jgi:gluconate 5-dehydrogenase
MPPPVSTFPDQFKLTGRTALITGSGRGLGWAMANGLAEAGARILLHGRKRDRLAPRLEELRSAGRVCDSVGFDMADRAAMKEEIARAGAIDILIHNVGERDRRAFLDIEPEAFDRLIEVDLIAAHALVRMVLPGMVARGWGRLIMVTSIAGDLAIPNASSYVTAKGGLAAFTRSLAVEFGARGITANALSPGFFATETNERMIASPNGEKHRERTPAKRWAEPREIAGAAIFLASPAASYVNGHTLIVDGGVSATYLS